MYMSEQWSKWESKRVTTRRQCNDDIFGRHACDRYLLSVPSVNGSARSFSSHTRSVSVCTMDSTSMLPASKLHDTIAFSMCMAGSTQSVISATLQRCLAPLENIRSGDNGSIDWTVDVRGCSRTWRVLTARRRFAQQILFIEQHTTCYSRALLCEQNFKHPGICGVRIHASLVWSLVIYMLVMRSVQALD